MTNQLLFGDTYEIINESKEWYQVKTAYDDYEGWLDKKQKRYTETLKGCIGTDKGCIGEGKGYTGKCYPCIGTLKGYTGTGKGCIGKR